VCLLRATADSLDMIRRILVFLKVNPVALVHESLFKTASDFHNTEYFQYSCCCPSTNKGHHSITLSTSCTKQNYLCAINQRQLHRRHCSVDKTHTANLGAQQTRVEQFWTFKQISNYLYHLPSIIELQLAHTVCLSHVCGSQNKLRLFPYTTLTGWFL
jgi:hypothetical protein